MLSKRQDAPTLIDGPALALSGGGYRAALFHLGALWRLNELGWLTRLKRIDGVSGGAVVGAWLGLQWDALDFDAAGVARNFQALVAAPLMRLASRVLDIPVGLAALCWPVSALPYALAHHLFGNARLAALPDGRRGPLVCALATNLLTGGLVEFSARGIRESYLGEHPDPGLALATAVAASCSIPPSFRPLALRLDPALWRGDCAPEYLHTRRAACPLRLADGGNYDNQALSAVRAHYATLLVSDGSAPTIPWRWVSGDWLTTTLRSNRVLIDQIRQLQQRLLHDAHHGEASPQRVAYWAVASRIEDYGAEGALPCAPERTLKLARVRTRMGRYTPQEQGWLVNWGYGACDAALRGSLAPDAAAPQSWPVPQHPLD